MESNRKRRGLIKAKLGLPFYKAAKPGSPAAVQYSTKAMDASVGYVVHQEFIITLPKPKISFVIPEKGRDSFENAYGDDNAVDLKAANYISSVQERFRHEQIGSERMNKCQDVVP